MDASHGDDDGSDIQELVMAALIGSKVPMSARDIGKRCRAFRALPTADRDALLALLVEDRMLIAEKTSQTIKFVASRSVK